MEDWRKATLKMINRIKASGFLTISTQDSIVKALNFGVSYSPRIIISRLADKNLRDATFCLEMYRKQYEPNIISAILLFFVKLSRRFEPTLYLFSALRNIYQLFKPENNKSLQKKYGCYSNWL